MITMMYKTLLIRFMEEQAKQLEKAGVKKEDYFNEKDKNCIMNWSEEECKKIWNTINKNLFRFIIVDIPSEISPFCIKQGYPKENFCDNCEYKKNRDNKECFYAYSEYFNKVERKIIDYEYDRNDYVIDFDWYLNIVRKLEKEVLYNG